MGFREDARIVISALQDSNCHTSLPWKDLHPAIARLYAPESRVHAQLIDIFERIEKDAQSIGDRYERKYRSREFANKFWLKKSMVHRAILDHPEFGVSPPTLVKLPNPEQADIYEAMRVLQNVVTQLRGYQGPDSHDLIGVEVDTLIVHLKGCVTQLEEGLVDQGWFERTKQLLERIPNHIQWIAGAIGAVASILTIIELM